MNGWCSREDSRLTFIDQTFGSLSAVLAYAYDFPGPRRNGVRPRNEKGKYWLQGCGFHERLVFLIIAVKVKNLT